MVGILEKGLAKVADDPAYRKTIEPTGTDIYYAPSLEFATFLRDEIKRFGTILRESPSGLPRATLRFGNLTFPRGNFL